MRWPGTRRTLPVIALVLCSCGTPPAPQPQQQTARLDAYHWKLATAFDGRGQPEGGWQLPGHPPLQLRFEDERLTVQNLCNIVGASYSAANGTLDVRRPVSTLRACPEAELMALERRVSAQLPQASRYAIRTAPGAAAPALLMHFTDGSRWELAGTPTPSTRFGGPGERMFLEVAPARVPCPPAGATCLNVREVRFDEQGLRQGTGEWRPFQGEIEGYTHQDGLRSVLRVQRYPLPSPRSGQTESFAYVLDLVVESGSAR